MPLCMKQPPCVLWKPYNTLLGLGDGSTAHAAPLMQHQRLNKALSHLSPKHICVFMDRLHLLHNFSKEWAQVLILSLGLQA